jgi:hypothetical protein
MACEGGDQEIGYLDISNAFFTFLREALRVPVMRVESDIAP